MRGTGIYSNICCSAKKKEKKSLDLLSIMILQVQKAICGEFNVQIAANNSNYSIGIGNIRYIPAVAM